MGGVRATWGVVLAMIGVAQMVLLFARFRRHLLQWLSPDYLPTLSEWQSAAFAVCLAFVASSSLWLLYQVLKAAERLSLPEPWVKLALARNANFLKVLLGLSKVSSEASDASANTEAALDTPADLGADDTPTSDLPSAVDSASSAADVVPSFRLRNALGIVCYLVATPAPVLLMWLSFSGLDSVALQPWGEGAAIRKTHVFAAMIGHLAIHLAAVWFASQLLKVGERFALPSAWVQRGIVREPQLLKALLGVDDPSVGMKAVAADTEAMLRPVEAVKTALRE